MCSTSRPSLALMGQASSGWLGCLKFLSIQDKARLGRRLCRARGVVFFPLVVWPTLIVSTHRWPLLIHLSGHWRWYDGHLLNFRFNAKMLWSWLLQQLNPKPGRTHPFISYIPKTRLRSRNGKSLQRRRWIYPHQNFCIPLKRRNATARRRKWQVHGIWLFIST